MSKFTDTAPRIMRDLLNEPHFGFGVYDVCAIVGNFAGETGGFEHWQELAPTVPGSRGGWGWPQWTGSRRVEFEAWCKRKGLSPTSYEANYSFVIRELLTTEKRAVAAVKEKVTLTDKVVAFEQAYERAGVKNYPKRIEWAQECLKLYRAGKVKPLTPPVEPVNDTPVEPPKPVPVEPVPPPPVEPVTEEVNVERVIILVLVLIICGLVFYIFKAGV